MRKSDNTAPLKNLFDKFVNTFICHPSHQKLIQRINHKIVCTNMESEMQITIIAQKVFSFNPVSILTFTTKINVKNIEPNFSFFFANSYWLCFFFRFLSPLFRYLVFVFLFKCLYEIIQKRHLISPLINGIICMRFKFELSFKIEITSKKGVKETISYVKPN